MKTIIRFALLALLALVVSQTATTVRAARLVLLAVNSGSDTTAPYANNQPPNLLPPGAKGFLIGVDLQDDLQDVPLGIQNVEFKGVIHQQGQYDDLGDPLPTPLNIKTRSQASLQQVLDVSALGLPVNAYLRSDSYVMDNAQQGSYVWTPVGPGIQGGAPGDNFLRITASLGLPSAIDGPGPVQLAYIVATGNVHISGFLARGTTGFDVCGNPIAGGPGMVLNFEQEELFCVPEPASLVLAGLGVVGACCWASRRRAKRPAQCG